MKLFCIQVTIHIWYVFIESLVSFTHLHTDLHNIEMLNIDCKPFNFPHPRNARYYLLFLNIFSNKVGIWRVSSNGFSVRCPHTWLKNIESNQSAVSLFGPYQIWWFTYPFVQLTSVKITYLGSIPVLCSP